ncbi:MAG: YjjW family glycine radical enzyme activase [Actinomycetia bacterium]|nr:YjjW family glycine radical enzyme activase [Actinomycetes bacterium]
MNETHGLVTDTIPFSNVDGPGNRFTVFLQGCNFNCVACHNPYTIGVCDDCGACVEGCPTGALVIGSDGVDWNQDACDGGDQCTSVCPIDATPKAKRRSVRSLLIDIERAAPFLSGVTVSGGEATQQADFVDALFTAIKSSTNPRVARLSCMVDTNGAVDTSVWNRLSGVMDAAMVDLKCFDDGIHQQMTGSSNNRTLESIEHLAHLGLLYEVRLLLVAGINDEPNLLGRTGTWLAEVDPSMRIKLMAYRSHGVRPADPPLVEPGRDLIDRASGALTGASADFDITLV